MLESQPAIVHSDEPPSLLNLELPFIELCIPADPDYVRTVRLAAGDIGGRAGLSVDELDDVRIAVDELCSTLIAGRVGSVVVRMQATGRALTIEGRTRDARPVIELTELSEMLVYALVDFCVFTIRDHDACFEMRKMAREIP